MFVIKFLIGLVQAIALLLVIMLASFHRKGQNASTIIYFLIATSLTSSILNVCFPVVKAHGNGAPKSRCESMVPGHWVNAQTSLSPYQIFVDKSVIIPGDRVNITLKTIPGQTGFKGFFVMVKEAEPEEGFAIESGNQPIRNNFGTFDLTASDMAQAQPVHCFDQRNSAMTHVVNYVKDSVELFWIAPKLISEDRKRKQGRSYMEKELKIVATFVKDFWTYWADIEPLGDVRLLLTDVQPERSQLSPKFKSTITPTMASTPSLSAEIPSLVEVPMQNKETTLSDREDSIPPMQLDDNNSWNHFKRAWSFIVDLIGSSSTSS